MRWNRTVVMGLVAACGPQPIMQPTVQPTAQPTVRPRVEADELPLDDTGLRNDARTPPQQVKTFEIRIYTGSAAEVARTLRDLLDASVGVHAISADEERGVLIVRATDDGMEALRSLIGHSNPPAVSHRVIVVPVSNGDAVTILPFAAVCAGHDGNASADEATNSVVVLVEGADDAREDEIRQCLRAATRR